MASRDSQIKTRTVQNIVLENKDNCLWAGSSFDEILQAVTALNLELPPAGRYFFNKRGTTLEISEETSGIARYRLNTSACDVDMADHGVSIRLHASFPIDTIKIFRSAQRIPASAKSFRQIDGPIDLLDEYAELYQLKKTNGSLGAQEQKRFDKLVSLIADGYQKIRKSREIPSSRSTPVSSGESRSGSSSSYGG